MLFDHITEARKDIKRIVDTGSIVEIYKEVAELTPGSFIFAAMKSDSLLEQFGKEKGEAFVSTLYVAMLFSHLETRYSLRSKLEPSDN